MRVGRRVALGLGFAVLVALRGVFVARLIVLHTTRTALALALALRGLDFVVRAGGACLSLVDR